MCRVTWVVGVWAVGLGSEAPRKQGLSGPRPWGRLETDDTKARLMGSRVTGEPERML